MFYPYRLAALCAACITCGPLAQAQAPANESLNMREALQRVSAYHPALAAYLPRLKALDGDRASASLRPPLRLSADADEFLGTRNAEGLEGIELTLALSGVIEFGARPAARVAVIDARESLMDAERRTQALDGIAEAARRYVQLAALQQEFRVAKQAEALARETLQTIQTRVDRGRAPRADLRRARAAAARASLEVGHIAHQLPTERVRLAALWGQTEPTFSRVDDDALFHPGIAGDFETIAEALMENPDLQQLAGRERIESAQLRLAESNGRGELTWRAGLRRLEGTDSNGLVAGISLPLFTDRRAQGDISAAGHRRDAARLDLEAARIVAHATLFEAWQHRAHAIEAFTALRDEVIPELELALTETREAYAAARYSYLDLISARRELIEARLALLDAARRAHLNRIELERLAGAALSETLTKPAGSNEDSSHEH